MEEELEVFVATTEAKGEMLYFNVVNGGRGAFCKRTEEACVKNSGFRKAPWSLPVAIGLSQVLALTISDIVTDLMPISELANELSRIVDSRYAKLASATPECFRRRAREGTTKAFLHAVFKE